MSDLTDHVGLVTDPPAADTRLKRVQLVKVSDGRALAIFAEDSGQVRDSLIAVPPFLAANELEHLSNMLSAELMDVPVSETGSRIKELAAGAVAEQKMVMNAVFEAINNSREAQGMHRRGKQNLWRYPEYQDLGKAEQLMNLLDTRDGLASLLSSGRDLEFSIRIGTELSQLGWRCPLLCGCCWC